MRKINRWLNHETDEVVISEDAPHLDELLAYEATHEDRESSEYDFLCSRCYQFYPDVNVRRVHGSSFLPYKGSSVWAREANRELSEIARGNFERGRR